MGGYPTPRSAGWAPLSCGGASLFPPAAEQAPIASCYVARMVVEVGSFDLDGYRFGGGIGAMHRGVSILVEGAGAATPATLLDAVHTVCGYIDTLGPGELRPLTRVAVLAGACPLDASYRKRYGIPDFFVRAHALDGVIKFWRSNTRTTRLFHHEHAHLLDAAGLIPSAVWLNAVMIDDAANRALTATGWKLSELPVDHFEFERDHLLLAPGGVTVYAEHARANGGTWMEDKADAVAWHKLSARVGAVARATSPTGQVRELAFADLFPARARIVANALVGEDAGAHGHDGVADRGHAQDRLELAARSLRPMRPGVGPRRTGGVA